MIFMFQSKQTELTLTNVRRKQKSYAQFNVLHDFAQTASSATPKVFVEQKSSFIHQGWPFCSQAQGNLSEILSSNDPELQTTEVVP